MAGLYAFKTREPLVGQLFSGTFQGGELVVNGSAVAKFYSDTTTPPSLPAPVNGMLLSMRVRDVGTFIYDAASWRDAVYPAGQCRQ
jgi:hypothetical protein